MMTGARRRRGRRRVRRIPTERKVQTVLRESCFPVPRRPSANRSPFARPNRLPSAISLHVPRRSNWTIVLAIRLCGSHRSKYTPPEPMTDPRFGGGRYVRPIDLSSRFCQSRLGWSLALTRKRLPNGRHRRAERDHARDRLSPRTRLV